MPVNVKGLEPLGDVAVQPIAEKTAERSHDRARRHAVILGHLNRSPRKAYEVHSNLGMTKFAPLAATTEAVDDYLKAILELSGPADGRVTSNALATHLGIRAAS